ncbi:hypothetical protein acdb102_22910 [Acidothermaceae bacterium B102]|nr:hypothetical protein acdb102_22910 [Acidothermaceae bacterium B102]
MSATFLAGRRMAVARSIVALATASSLSLLAVAIPAGAAPSAPDCTASQPRGPVQVTPDCVDPLYADPVIDSEQDLTSPIVHHRVSGHFAGTSVKFTIYLPPASQWQGRFFQYTYPLSDENALDKVVSFSAASGGYTVQASGIVGYRHDAATAKFAETVAAAYYGSRSRHIFGYLYGPSGGSFQTIGAMENTTGVWAGAVPMVIGVPTSVPTNFFLRAQARMVLAGVANKISDAEQPGGSGNPYAGLTRVQAQMLHEVTSLGLPLRAWQDADYVLGLSTTDGLLGFGPVVRQIDPTYVTDFWTKPGYLGTEQSPLGDIVRAALVDVTPIITNVAVDAQGAPTVLTLTGLPHLTSALGLDVNALASDGTTSVGAVSGTLDPTTGLFTVGSGNSADVLAALTVGARVHVDNRWYVALPSYYRHQVPPLDQGYAAFDVLRRPDGQPLYPQRPLLIGSLISGSTTGGGTYTGKITGKMIVLDNLDDPDAFAWPADWYAQRVRSALGDRAFGNNFRLYYNDNADHLDGPVSPPKSNRIVSYDAILEQALRDVSAWAERGVQPPQSTRYQVSDGQVSVPRLASQRRGLQPVVDLRVRGGDRVDLRVGQTARFVARAQVPQGGGAIVAASWDFTGAGTFSPINVARPGPALHLVQTHQFTAPGTYYVSFKVASSRTGGAQPFAQIENLDRVRVVVHAAP